MSNLERLTVRLGLFDPLENQPIGRIDALHLSLSMRQIQAFHVRAVSFHVHVVTQHNPRHPREKQSILALNVREAVLVHLLLLAVPPAPLLERFGALGVDRGLDFLVIAFNYDFGCNCNCRTAASSWLDQAK